MKLEQKEVGIIALKTLLKKQKLSGEETEQRFKLACSVDYWKKLNPQLKVCENFPFVRMLSIGKAVRYYSIHVLTLNKFRDLSAN